MPRANKDMNTKHTHAQQTKRSKMGTGDGMLFIMVVVDVLVIGKSTSEKRGQINLASCSLFYY